MEPVTPLFKRAENQICSVFLAKTIIERRLDVENEGEITL
jgi:hypothetical protein